MMLIHHLYLLSMIADGSSTISVQMPTGRAPRKNTKIKSASKSARLNGTIDIFHKHKQSSNKSLSSCVIEEQRPESFRAPIAETSQVGLDAVYEQGAVDYTEDVLSKDTTFDRNRLQLLHQANPSVESVLHCQSPVSRNFDSIPCQGNLNCGSVSFHPQMLEAPLSLTYPGQDMDIIPEHDSQTYGTWRAHNHSPSTIKTADSFQQMQAGHASQVKAERLSRPHLEDKPFDLPLMPRKAHHTPHAGGCCCNRRAPHHSCRSDDSPTLKENCSFIQPTSIPIARGESISESQVRYLPENFPSFSSSGTEGFDTMDIRKQNWVDHSDEPMSDVMDPGLWHSPAEESYLDATLARNNFNNGLPFSTNTSAQVQSLALSGLNMPLSKPDNVHFLPTFPTFSTSSMDINWPSTNAPFKLSPTTGANDLGMTQDYMFHHFSNGSCHS